MKAINKTNVIGFKRWLSKKYGCTFRYKPFGSFCVTLADQVFLAFKPGIANRRVSLRTQSLILTHEVRHVLQFDVRFPFKYATDKAARSQYEYEAIKSALDLYALFVNYSDKRITNFIRWECGKLKKYRVSARDIALTERKLMRYKRFVLKKKSDNKFGKAVIAWWKG